MIDIVRMPIMTNIICQTLFSFLQGLAGCDVVTFIKWVTSWSATTSKIAKMAQNKTKVESVQLDKIWGLILNLSKKQISV